MTVSRHDILKSDEMTEVVNALDALRARFTDAGAYKTDYEWPLAIARIGRFRAGMVLQIVLGNDEYYPGYKEVLTAALGGWLLAPRSRVFREALMRHAALTHMEAAASKAGSDEPMTLREDILGRYVFLGQEFLTQIYDCLGGYRAFAEAPSHDELWSLIDIVDKSIQTTTRALAYLHRAVDRFGRPGFAFTPSLSKAVSVFDELKSAKRAFPFREHYISRSLLHQRWSQNKQTLAFLYAASTIRVNRKTLLQLILDGLLDYNDHRHAIFECAARARYVVSHIFDRMKDANLSRESHKFLGGGPSKKFSPPALTKIEGECFDIVFRQFIRSI